MKISRYLEKPVVHVENPKARLVRSSYKDMAIPFSSGTSGSSRNKLRFRHERNHSGNGLETGDPIGLGLQVFGVNQAERKFVVVLGSRPKESFKKDPNIKCPEVLPTKVSRVAQGCAFDLFIYLNYFSQNSPSRVILWKKLAHEPQEKIAEKSAARHRRSSYRKISNWQKKANRRNHVRH